MKTLKQIACLLVIAVASGASAQDAKEKPGAKLVNEMKVFKLDGSRQIRENSGLHSMNLSPDGKTLLYIQRIKPANKDAGSAYKLVVRDIKSGKDTILPGAPSDSDDFMVACVSMQLFDAKGENIVFAMGKGTEPLDPGDGEMQLGIYNIKSGKVDKKDLTAPIVFPTYDAAGKNLIVFLMFKGNNGPDLAASKIVVSPADKMNFKKIGLMGLPRSPCPGSTILSILLPPQRSPDDGARAPGMVLYDTKADKQVSAPTLESGNKLDDYNPQWTPDGRYMYYVDNEKDMDPKGRKRRKSVTRIWDRKKNAEHAVIEGVIPVGPGPGKSDMILLNHEDDKYAIHNSATGKTSPLGAGKMKILCSNGKYVIYARPDQNGDAVAYRAEIK